MRPGRLRILLLVCCLAVADRPLGAGDFGHDLAAARLLEASVLKRPGDYQATQPEVIRIEIVYQNLATRYPNKAAAHQAYAEFLQQIGNPRAAEEWNTAETLDPQNAAAASCLGGCCLRDGDTKKAIEYFTLAAKLAPQNPLYHFDLANSMFVFRQSAPGGDGNAVARKAVLLNALAEYKKAADLDPFNVEYAQAYAETFYGLKQPDWRDALLAWTHCLDLKEHRDFCYVNLARVNIELGRTKDALDALGNVTSPDFHVVKVHLLQKASAQAAAEPIAQSPEEPGS